MTVGLTDVEKHVFLTRFEGYRDAARLALQAKMGAFSIAVGLGLVPESGDGVELPFDYFHHLGDGSKPEDQEDYIFETALQQTFASFDADRALAEKAVARRLALDPPDTEFEVMATLVFGTP